MIRKVRLTVMILLVLSAVPMAAGTGRPEDGLLFFLVLMAFLGIVLALLQAGHWIIKKIGSFLEGILEGLNI